MGIPLMSTRVWETLLNELMFFMSGGVQHGLPAGPHSAVGRDSERSLSQNFMSRDAPHTSLTAVSTITSTGNRPMIQPIASAHNGYTYGPYEAGWYSTQLKKRINYRNFVLLVWDLSNDNIILYSRKELQALSTSTSKTKRIPNNAIASQSCLVYRWGNAPTHIAKISEHTHIWQLVAPTNWPHIYPSAEASTFRSIKENNFLH